MIKRFLKQWANRRSFRQAVKQADGLRAKTFKKYFVIKLEGEFRVFSKQRLKLLHKTRFFNKGISMAKLESCAVYTTK